MCTLFMYPIPSIVLCVLDYYNVNVYLLCCHQDEGVPPEEEPGPPAVQKKWWQFWKSSNKPLKFGWITGVLVSVCIRVCVCISIV